MARPRKDGTRAAQAIRIGRERVTAEGRRWNLRALAPTTGAPHGRITFIPTGKSRPTTRTPRPGQTLDELFDHYEALFDAHVAVGASDAEGGARTIATLGELYLADLQDRGRSAGYIGNRRCIIGKWITPLIGSVLVENWDTTHSTKVINAARAKVGGARVEDIGSTLSGMRSSAQRKRDGHRWLSLTEDPLEGVSYSRKATKEGAGRNYVPPHLRPSQEAWDKAKVAATEVGRWDWMRDILDLAGNNGPRLAEQLGLRAIDVDLEAEQLDINGRWMVERKAATPGGQRRGHRAPGTKNGKHRVTPLYGSQVPGLTRRCAIALGLPEDSGRAAVAAAIDAERRRRAASVRTGDWRDYEAPSPAEECWLFPREDGVPPTKEQFNDAWHQIRDASGWNTHIPYKNLRHLAVARYRRFFTYEAIAPWTGHDVNTLMSYYILQAEDALVQARKVLRDK
jgi:hypothetical protein